MADVESNLPLINSIDDLKKAVSKSPVFIFGKTTCPFCMEVRFTNLLEQQGSGSPYVNAIEVKLQSLSFLTLLLPSRQVEDTFTKLQAPTQYFWINKEPNGSHVHTLLKEEYKQRTVPYVFIGGELQGGCDAVKALEREGKLNPLISKATSTAGIVQPGSTAPSPAPAAVIVAPKNNNGNNNNNNKHGVVVDKYAPNDDDDNNITTKDPNELLHPKSFECAAKPSAPKAIPCLFWFPEVVDANSARVVAGFTTIISILSIIWRNHLWAQYMMLGLFVDFILRFMYGTGPSILGQTAKLIMFPVTPRFVPGFPKQFAASVGVAFTGLATLFYLLTGFDPQNIIGACIAAVLALFAFLECSIDFCAGCWMFGLMVQLNLVPRTIYSIAVATKPEAMYTYEEHTKKVDDVPLTFERKTYHLPNHGPSIIDLNYKVKKEDWRGQEINLIKYSKIGDQQIALSLCGMASVWKVAANPYMGLDISLTVTKVFQIISVVVFGIVTILYALKAVSYPSKVVKEWQCPLRRNSFALLGICLMLIGYNCYGLFEHSSTLANVLFWVGAVFNLAFGFITVAMWISRRLALEHVNAAWMMPPVGCIVAAVVGPYLDYENYAEASFFWFSFAIIMWIILLPITFYKFIVNVDADERIRPLIWIYLAPPALAAVAYFNMTHNISSLIVDGFNNGSGAIAAIEIEGFERFDSISKIFYFISLSFFFILGWLFITGHFVRGKFSIASWAYCFPIQALAMATIQWAAGIDGNWPRGMAYTGLAISTATTAVCSLQTLYMLVMGDFFAADHKYGPLSQQLLTHEAFRGAMPKLLAACGALDAGSGGKVGDMAVSDFLFQYRRFFLIYHWHSVHEDKVLFKYMDQYFPGVTDKFREDHEEEHIELEKFSGWVKTLEISEDSASRSAAVRELQAALPPFFDHFEEHLVGEEVHLQPVGRKNFPISLQKKLMEDIFDLTPPDVWAKFMPWCINNQPMIMQKVRFLRAWMWAMPDRAQYFGRVVQMGVDSVLWARLMQWVPEIAPRGDTYHVKYY